MRRLGAASVIVVVLAFFAVACAGLTNPFAPQVQALCPGALYCGSAVVPQTVSGGTCCVVTDLANSGRLVPNAALGYLCAFGSGKPPAGCVASLEQARFICPNAPSVVRCTAE